MPNKPKDTSVIDLLSDKEKIRAGMRGIIQCADVHVAALEQDRGKVERAYAPLVGAANLTRNTLYDSYEIYKDELSNPWEEGDYESCIQSMPAAERNQWHGLYQFLVHDIAHIEASEMHMHAHQVSFWNYVGQVTRGEREKTDRNYNNDILADDWQQVYQNTLPLVPNIVTQLSYPHLFAKAVAELKLKRNVSDLQTIEMCQLTETELSPVLPAR